MFIFLQVRNKNANKQRFFKVINKHEEKRVYLSDNMIFSSYINLDNNCMKIGFDYHVPFKI